MKLYELTEEAEEILLAIEELEESENEEQAEELKKVKSLIDAEVAKKSEAIIYITRNIESDIEAIDGEIKRLQALKKKKTNTFDRLKTLVKNSIEKIGKKKIETSLGNLTVRKNPVSIKVVDESLVPNEFVKTDIVKKIDKKKIKDWLKETGEVVAGTEVVESTSLLVPHAAKKGDE